MWVDAVRMRNAGHKLSPEDLRTATPVRGQLWLTKFRPAVDNSTTPLMAALIVDSAHVWPVLDWAVVRSIRNGQLVVTGVEDLGSGPKRVQNYRQSWWCRIVTEAAPAPEVSDPLVQNSRPDAQGSRRSPA